MIAASPSSVLLAVVAEDEPLILMETADLLADRGYTVLEAYNATQALALLAEHPEITLLVSDVQMPGPMKGFALAREAHRLYPQLAIVVCSGVVQPEADELPATALFIDKPLSTQVLARTLSQLQAPPTPL